MTTKLISPRFIKNRTILTLDYLKKRIHAKGLPLEFSIELTNHCNSKCIMCPRTIMKRKLGYISFTTFKKIIDEIKDYCEFIYLHLSGEPLLHKQFDKMIKYAKKNNLKTGISTNAILLNKKNIKKLLSSNLDFIILSIDAANKDTYLKIRGTNSFNIVNKNILEFLNEKLKLKIKKPYSAVQLIYMEENKNEVNKFIKSWKNKADVIRIKPVLNIGNILKTKIINRKKPCILLWRQMAILWNGDVVSCCLDYLGETVLGNIHKQKINEIWNSKNMQEIRLNHIKGEYNKIKICRDCTAPDLNLPLILSGIIVDAYTTKRMLMSLEKMNIIKNINLFD